MLNKQYLFLNKYGVQKADQMILQTDFPNEESSTSPRLQVRQGLSINPDVNEAVRDLAAQIQQPNTQVSLIFFSDEYDPQQLGQALKEHLHGPVIGCTTAGQLTETGF